MKTFVITVEAEDHVSQKEMESVIDNALNDSFFNCTYEVEEKED